jgi:anti-sigma B factor antagonist
MIRKEPNYYIELSSTDRDIVIVKCIGDWISPLSPSFIDAVRQQLNSGTKAIILDLSGITFIDSAGLGTLLAAYSSARSKGAYCSFAQSARVGFALVQAKVNVPYFDTVDEAIVGARKRD